jgi:hypothetical protein
MISLRPKQGAKLPFITEVRKLSYSKKDERSDNYANRMGLDLGKIKD